MVSAPGSAVVSPKAAATASTETRCSRRSPEPVCEVALGVEVCPDDVGLGWPVPDRVVGWPNALCPAPDEVSGIAAVVTAPWAQAARSTMIPSEDRGARTRFAMTAPGRERRSPSLRLDSKSIRFLHAGSHRVPYTSSRRHRQPGRLRFSEPRSFANPPCGGGAFCDTASLCPARRRLRSRNRVVTGALPQHQISECSMRRPVAPATTKAKQAVISCRSVVRVAAEGSHRHRSRRVRCWRSR